MLGTVGHWHHNVLPTWTRQIGLPKPHLRIDCAELQANVHALVYIVVRGVGT